MHFSHSPAIWQEYPELVPGLVLAHEITGDVSVRQRVTELAAVAASRLGGRSEAELPEIQAWRRVFARMGLKPTQYRCASEALLRRFRKEGALPEIHPLVDLCNAASLAFAVPVAAFDVSRVAGCLEVRQATGSEVYESFSGEVETPAPGEVIFADESGRAHARRWTNRQSRYSAVGAGTAQVLIVAEAVHESADADVRELTATLADAISTTWPGGDPTTAVLTGSAPRFEFSDARA